MIEASFFYQVIEAVDIVAEEYVTGKKTWKSIGDLTSVNGWFSTRRK